MTPNEQGLVNINGKAFNVVEARENANALIELLKRESKRPLNQKRRALSYLVTARELGVVKRLPRFISEMYKEVNR